MATDWESIKTIVSLAALLLGLLSFWDKKWGEVARMKEEIALMSARTPPDNLSRLVALETRVGPFWKVLEDNLVDFLKRPTHRVMDDLLDKYKSNEGQLTLEDLTLLKTELVQVIAEYRDRKVQRKLEEAEAGLVVGYVFMLGMVESRICEKEAHGESFTACTHKGKNLIDRKT